MTYYAIEIQGFATLYYDKKILNFKQKFTNKN